MIGFALFSIFVPAFRSEGFRWWYSVFSLVIFAGLTTYDTQKIKAMNIIGNEGTECDTKEAVFGALTLYLDLSICFSPFFA